MAICTFGDIEDRVQATIQPVITLLHLSCSESDVLLWLWAAEYSVVCLYGAGDDGLVAASETIESMELENNEACAVIGIPSVDNFLDMGIEGYEGHYT